MNNKTFQDHIQFLHTDLIHVGTENDSKHIVQIDDRQHMIVLLYWTPETLAFGYKDGDGINCDEARVILTKLDPTKPVLVAPYHDSFNKLGEIYTTYTRQEPYNCIDLACMTKSLRPFHEMIEDLVQLRDRAKERQTELENIIIATPVNINPTEAQTEQFHHLTSIILDTDNLIEQLEHYLGNEQLHG